MTLSTSFASQNAPVTSVPPSTRTLWIFLFFNSARTPVRSTSTHFRNNNVNAKLPQRFSFQPIPAVSEYDRRRFVRSSCERGIDRQSQTVIQYDTNQRSATRPSAAVGKVRIINKRSVAADEDRVILVPKTLDVLLALLRPKGRSKHCLKARSGRQATSRVSDGRRDVVSDASR